MSSAWFFHEDEVFTDGEYFTIFDPFEGILLRVRKDSAEQLQNVSDLRFRTNNRPEYEPALDENEHRIGDTIQIYPREFKFSSPALLKVALPSCVKPPQCGQLVCLYSGNPSAKNGDNTLRWKPIDSECFRVNDQRTCATILCKYTGLYCFKVTQYPEVTKVINPEISCLLRLKECSGVELSYPQGCVTRETNVTLKAIYLEELYNVPYESPVSPIVRLIPSLQVNRENGSVGTLDVTVSPAVLVRPFKHKFSKPLKLTLPLLAEGFENFFLKENARFVALQSQALDEDRITWKHHYSTPEVRRTAV